MKNLVLLFTAFFISNYTWSQIVINEGSNKNYQTIADEDGEYEDWIELYNTGTSAVDLFGYSLTDNSNEPAQWVFPHYNLNPGEFLVVFCSDKNRFASTPFTTTINSGSFTPVVGWNTHIFTTPFQWDGLSSIAINVCSYSNTGYISNSSFMQTATAYGSTTYSFNDGSEGSCSYSQGTLAFQRPNMKLNGITIGTGTIQNGYTDYPAPYGNWYWSARNQMLIPAVELTAAGLSAGPITSLGFQVASTEAVNYTYVELALKNVSETAMSSDFLTSAGNQFHTNFKISGSGDTLFLFNPAQTLENSLIIKCQTVDMSIGRYPNGSNSNSLFNTPTPEASNNGAPSLGNAIAPLFDHNPGIYAAPFSVSILDLNTAPSTIRYTTDGSDPDFNSPIYDGTPIFFFQSKILRARSFKPNHIPSNVTSASFLFNISHTTPILSITTDNANLYGDQGIFDHWDQDWLRNAHIDYFDSIPGHPLVFTQNTGMQIDGGAGGSRSQPQHSFRLELAHSVLGENAVNEVIIPGRPNRNKYSEFYLRNGSNQYLALPYKEACQAELMCRGANAYYSAYRPATVYINGQYFGLYELREKYNAEMFKENEGANKDSVEIMSLSYWYGGMLRAVEGSTDNFWNSYNAFNALNEGSPNYWNDADQHIDMTYYTDYIISESWMGNVDWPGNNIKIYRSNVTNNRWRFATIDLELALNPNAWTDCYFNHIDYMSGQSTDNPYINIWLQSIQNTQYKHYFINRFADLMNTNYRPERLIAVENRYFNLTAPEMPNEYQRWGDAGNVPGQMDYFYNNHLTFQSELLCRTEQVRDHIQNRFALPQQVDVTLDVLPAGSGKIHISTIQPTEYPWTGVYFDGVPVKIEAIANPGYEFAYWDNSSLINDILDSVWEGNISLNTAQFTAHFQSNVNVTEQEESVFRIYPSPAQDYIQVVAENQFRGLSYSIFDIQGKLIHIGNMQNQGSTRIDVSQFSAGMYAIQISDSLKGIVAKKIFVKE